MAERPQGYGMTAELQAKKDAKRDPVLEAEARDWLQAVVGEPFPSGSFEDALKDGVFLCKAINAVDPGKSIKINYSKMAFKQMENIGNFLEACDSIGVSKTDMFQTVDLYEAMNIPQVTNGIHALGRKLQAKGYNVPAIGPKEADEQKREFSEEQLKAGQNVIGLQMGSNRGASQAGMTAYGAQRQIH